MKVCLVALALLQLLLLVSRGSCLTKKIKGLKKYDVIDMVAVGNKRPRQAYFIIKGKKNAQAKDYFMMRMIIQAKRKTIIVSHGYTRQDFQRNAKLCRLGEVLTQGKVYRMQIVVYRSAFMIYFNGTLKFRLPIDTGALRIENVTEIKLLGSSETTYVRMQTTEEMADEMEDPQCGPTVPGKTIPSFCPTSKRIVGGVNSNPGSIPWQVSLRKKALYSNQANPHFCGGSLINNCWVVTAGHCFLTTTPSRLKKMVVRVGDYYNRDNSPYSRVSSVEDSQDIDIAAVYKHEKYKDVPTLKYDIALVKLNVCVTYNRFVQPVCLPRERNQFPANTACGISGWGALYHLQLSPEFPPCLQSATVNIRADSLCASSFVPGKFLANKMICASSPGVDTCQGDSGGPLVCVPENTSRNTLWGITSWGEGCAEVKKPGVYTRVSTYLRWMYITMKLYPTLAKHEKDVSAVKANQDFCQYYSTR